MARTDAVVLGAGIVGTSIALQLVKRGLSVALVDRGGPGEETSYGNAGVIEGETVFPPAFPPGLGSLLRVGLKRAPEANYHLAFLPKVAPWLFSFWMASRPKKLLEFAFAMRPLFSRAVAEHEALMTEAGALQYLRKTGWAKIYRSKKTFAATAPELNLADELGIPYRALDPREMLELEPALKPAFERAIHWPGVASVNNPLAVTKAYGARYEALGGLTLVGDARTLHRNGSAWRVDTAQGALDAQHAIVALGPWAPDVLDPMGIHLPLGIKRGYHRQFRLAGTVEMRRPVVDPDNGYAVTPMQQGIRLTTGAEFADRDAPPTPVQFERLMPKALEVYPLGEQLEEATWLGKRPCFPDSRPVIGPAPGQKGLWLAYGHAHWGLTLGPTTGHLVADLVTGATPFCDPAPYAAERFL
ncbi:MAG TPA: FAD-binding oxidoreductase [Xanthobacteraceae bacterium]|nr:FAD-binding oxidoreductase [Xanthobacteraceae bacterium]